MLCFLAIIFWITIVGANYPSAVLSSFFNYIQTKLLNLFRLKFILEINLRKNYNNI